jgi:hypothetical protein
MRLLGVEMQIRENRAMAPTKENILYVVLHGLITLIDIKEKGFLAHLLDIGDDHKYLLGHWLEEADIPKRKKGADPLRATLTNVDTGAAQLNPDLNAVFKLEGLPNDKASDVRAVLRLPRPRSIHNFVSGKLPPGALAGDTTRLVQVPSKISGTTVFEYTFQNVDPVLTSDSGLSLWTKPALAIVKDPSPPATPTRELSVAALHVYDEPGIRLPGDELQNLPQHNRREFKLSSVFLNSDLVLVKDTGTPEQEAALSVPLGLLMGEVLHLDERLDFVLPMVISDREGDILAKPVGGGSSGPVCGGMHATM